MTHKCRSVSLKPDALYRAPITARQLTSNLPDWGYKPAHISASALPYTALVTQNTNNKKIEDISKECMAYVIFANKHHTETLYKLRAAQNFGIFDINERQQMMTYLGKNVRT